MITVQEFYDSLKETIKLTSGVDGSSIESEFLKYALEKLVDFGDINAYELVEDGIDSGERWRVDAFSIDNDSDISTGVASLFVSLFDQNDKPANLIQGDIDRLLKKLRNYIEYSLEKDIYSFFEPGSSHFQVALQLKEIWHKNPNPRLRLYVVSNRPISKRVTDIENVEIHGASAEVIVWDLNRFFQIELSGREREDLEIDLSATPINSLMATVSNEGVTKSVLAVMPASILVNIYQKWSGRLLEQNVRSFLSNRVSVNKGMRETIKNAPDKFFAFNNGITATAEDARFEQRNNGLFLTYLKNFQIVNGGQTTASLFSAWTRDKFDISAISVQMKLTIVSPEEANELVPFISRYANSQNKVSEADLFSNHEFHRRIEGFSRRIVAPPKPGMVSGSMWYYERARGQYLNEQAYKSESERKKFLILNPRDQMLSKTDFAKYINTFEAIPNVVSKGAQFNCSKFADKIVEAWEKSDSNVNEGYFRAAIAKAILFKGLEKLVQQEKNNWFNGYRAAIVTYTLALLGYYASLENKEINYELIWRNQAFPTSINPLLVKLAERVNSFLQDPNRPIGNVDSYAKSEGCWSKAKIDCMVNIDDFAEILISKSLAQEKVKEDKKLQRLTTSLEDEIKVKSITSDVWIKIAKYLEDNNLENPTKLTLISKAKVSPFNLSSKDCQSLFMILSDYETHYRN